MAHDTVVWMPSNVAGFIHEISKTKKWKISDQYGKRILIKWSLNDEPFQVEVNEIGCVKLPNMTCIYDCIDTMNQSFTDKAKDFVKALQGHLTIVYLQAGTLIVDRRSNADP